MKVSMARIRLYLKEGKTLSDGSNPILLMVSFNGRKELSTGFSCVPRYWDKKGECVKKGYPNYAAINSAILQMKNDAISRRNEFERLGIKYTPKMVLEECRESLASNGEITSLVESYVVDRGLRQSTIYNWRYVGRLLKEYGINDICELSKDKAFKWPTWLKENKHSTDGVIRVLVGKAKALCSYSFEKGLISTNPFDGLKYTQKYSQASNLLYIHYSAIEVMKLYLEGLMINQSKNGMWSYKDGVLEELANKNSSLFSIYFFVLDYLWQGLSPIDLAFVKVADIDTKNVNGVELYSWDGKRMKTSVGVKVRIPRHNRFVEMMMFPMMSRVGYALPFFDKNSNSPINTLKGSFSYTLSILRPKLKEHFRRINELIVQKNVDGASIPLINLECNYYAARHSFAMNYMLKGGTPMALATLLGRSPNSLAQYLAQLEEESDLVKYVSVL